MYISLFIVAEITTIWSLHLILHSNLRFNSHPHYFTLIVLMLTLVFVSLADLARLVPSHPHISRQPCLLSPLHRRPTDLDNTFSFSARYHRPRTDLATANYVLSAKVALLTYISLVVGNSCTLYTTYTCRLIFRGDLSLLQVRIIILEPTARGFK